MSIDKETIGWLTLALSLISYAPYLWAMYRRKIRPHAFSWAIWAHLSAIEYVALTVSNAGPGAWICAITAFFGLLIAVLSFFMGERRITRSDWASFLFAQLAIITWYFTNDPLWAVIIITAVTLSSYYPTIRKSLIYPEQEQITMFLLSGIRFTLALFALEAFTWTTALVHATTAIVDFLFVATLIFLRAKKIHMTPATLTVTEERRAG